MRVGVNREGQCLLLLGVLSTHDSPVRRVELRILFLEMCHDGINFRSIRNVDKHPGSLREVLGVNHSQFRTLPKLPKSADGSH